MKTFVTELAFLFVWISLCCGRVLLTGGNRPSFCLLPKETGVCRAALPRWYYNIDSDKCEQFIYGGCGGNENNFGTNDECEGNCTTNTGEEGRITDKTSVMFRRSLRRDLDPELNSSKLGTPASNVALQDFPDKTNKKTNLVSQSKNGDNAVETTAPSQSKSSSKKPATPASNVALEDSQDQTNKERKLVNQSKNGDNVVEKTAPSQSKSSSRKPATPASNVAQEDSQDQTNKETKLVNQSKLNGDNAVETTAPSQSKSSSRKPGTPASNVAQEDSQDQTNKETNLVNQPKNGDNDGKNVKPSQGEGKPSVETTELPTQPLDVGSGKFDGLPFQPEQGTNEDVEDALDFSHLQTSRKDSVAYPYEHTSSHFAAFFLTSIVMVFAAYVVYHNRQKIVAIVIEGRSDVNGRRRGYRKLETNVEEAMPSLKSSNSTYVY